MKVTSFLWGAIIALVLLRPLQAGAEVNPVFGNERVDTDQPCDIYLAPSKVGGWGVFAARDFYEGEVVEIAPRYVPMKADQLQKSVIDDYFYGFTFHFDPHDASFGNLVFGMTMFYNHGPGIKHNVLYTSFGKEPHKDLPWSSDLTGFVAIRNIKRGEELLSSYGETDIWFTARGLTMAQNDENEADLMPSLEQMQEREQKHCPKTIAGPGRPTWLQRLQPACAHYNIYLPPRRLHDMPLQDHPTAVAKEAVRAGQLLEMAPALVVPHDQMVFSPLAPMTIFWNDLDEEQQETIEQLQLHGVFRLKAVSNETGKMKPDILEYFNDAAILPAAGNIGLVRKVGREAESNTRIEIVAVTEFMDKLDDGSAGLILKLIATKEIEPGEELLLNLPDHSSWHSKMNLAQHLALTGQPIPKHLLVTDIPAIISDLPDDDDDDDKPELIDEAEPEL
jgi:FMN phosphatase YigB (HAD superfamily)